QAVIEQPLDCTVESAWSKADLAAGMLRDFLHYSVAVQIAVGECQQNMKDGGRQRQQFFRIGFLLRHVTLDLSASDISLRDIVASDAHPVNSQLAHSSRRAISGSTFVARRAGM